MKPIFWPRPVYELDPNDPANNGFINQDFLVWMRIAALPNFRKLYRRITEGDYAQGLPAGNYSLEIAYSILLHVTYEVVRTLNNILVPLAMESLGVLFFSRFRQLSSQNDNFTKVDLCGLMF